ncbi:lipoate--protein ligase [Fusibacter ferrireducens]|uniref:lipoate--protein ligase n=1 Tax=Fusibacter ferrireducens TaxID=2785058 RepID=A0ABR9ZQI2_9FIRM|nr:lipoate--protein ligase [Fusibacter ferrireducens]MBF4692403.1 lipoate--protein ligase [Fusibacter ferrireducens]
MNTTTKIYRSQSTNPWFNLALEEELVNSVSKDEIILYLWQNQNTVVIGKHQNPWREVLIQDLENDQGKLARRLSGGGAVFHDLGNLNFTFVMHKSHENLEKQLKVILDGVKALGIDAQFSGRNDILAEGRKFSGNAFYYGKENYYHHGTLLVDVDMKKLGRYLNVSLKKLNAKGVESVKSRVINLKDLNDNLTISMTIDALIDAFEKEYGKCDEITMISETTASKEALKRYHYYASWDWRFGKTPKFDVTFDEKFTWGEIVLNFTLKGGLIEETTIYSDAMSTQFIEQLQPLFNGLKLQSKPLITALEALEQYDSLKPMLADLRTWFDSFNL